MTLAELLDLISSVLVLGGLVWGAASLKRTESRLLSEKATIRRIREEVEAMPKAERFARTEVDPMTQRLRASGVPFTTYNDALYQKQDIELAAVDYLKPTLSGPFTLAVAGTVLGLVVAVINALTG